MNKTSTDFGRLLLLLSLLVGPTGVAVAVAPTTPDPIVKADKLAREGLQLARQKRFKQAAERFETALKLNPRAIFAHNLARANEELGHLARAYDFFSQALRLNPKYTFALEGQQRLGRLAKRLKKTHASLKVASLPAEVDLTLVEPDGTKVSHLRTPHRSWVKPGMVTLRGTKLGFRELIKVIEVKRGRQNEVTLTLKPLPRKGYLDVTSARPGLEVWVDGRSLGVAPLRGHILEGGSHRVVLRLGEKVIHTEDIIVRPEKVTSLAYDPLKKGALPPRRAGPSLLAFGLFGGGGLALLAGGGLHLVASSRMSEATEFPNIDMSQLAQEDPGYAASLAAKESNDARARIIEDDARTLETGAWISYSLAAGAFIAGTLLWVLDDAGSEERTEARVWPLLGVSEDGANVGFVLNF